ncbi:MAG TPA: hypothetical protein VN699_14165 [Pirellulales bacterium]|nr:hypothetical protein [Pirellulales bacterium]
MIPKKTNMPIEELPSWFKPSSNQMTAAGISPNAAPIAAPRIGRLDKPAPTKPSAQQSQAAHIGAFTTHAAPGSEKSTAASTRKNAPLVMQ